MSLGLAAALANMDEIVGDDLTGAVVADDEGRPGVLGDLGDEFVRLRSGEDEPASC